MARGNPKKPPWPRRRGRVISGPSKIPRISGQKYKTGMYRTTLVERPEMLQAARSANAIFVEAFPSAIEVNHYFRVYKNDFLAWMVQTDVDDMFAISWMPGDDLLLESIDWEYEDEDEDEDGFD